MTTSLGLSGRRALITGGGSGIGLASARLLALDGAAVTLMGRSADRLDSAAADLRIELREAGVDVEVATSTGDVVDESAVQGAVAIATGDTGALDIAVVAAGTGAGGPIVAVPAAAWQRVLDVNLTGAFFTIKHVGAAMVASGGGSIVAISSIAAPLTHRFMTPYCVSKAALEALVRGAADELGASGVRANAVRPGLVPTDLAASLVDNEGIKADYLSQIPLGRLGTTDDIASAVRYLAGDDASWVTGQCFAIDGGHTLRRGPDLAAAT